MVHLVPQDGVTGTQRINFAVPLVPGRLSNAALVTVNSGGVEVPAFSRGLASHPDGSLHSVQIQIDLDLAAEADVAVELGANPPAKRSETRSLDSAASSRNVASRKTGVPTTSWASARPKICRMSTMSTMERARTPHRHELLLLRTNGRRTEERGQSVARAHGQRPHGAACPQLQLAVSQRSDGGFVPSRLNWAP
jgi:hypothetical protein